MKRRIGIIIHNGALMDSIILRSAGFSGCTAWRKLNRSRADFRDEFRRV
jgi:hypothetical protein